MKTASEKGKMEVKFRKLKTDEIDVRVGTIIDSPNFKGVFLLLYKDARVDQTILDETVGAMNWQRSHLRDNANCVVSIWDKDKNMWVSKEDTGTESNTEAEKGLASDSFKRACVNWGIGRELYTAPKNLLVECDVTVDKNGKKLTPKGVSWYVKEIDYKDNAISHLVIGQKCYDKDMGEVYRLGERIKPKASSDDNATPEQIARIRQLVADEKKVCDHFHVDKLEQLSQSDAQSVIDIKEKQ